MLAQRRVRNIERPLDRAWCARRALCVLIRFVRQDVQEPFQAETRPHKPGLLSGPKLIEPCEAGPQLRVRDIEVHNHAVDVSNQALSDLAYALMPGFGVGRV